jgi:ketosteroid isomerase-like protein
MSNTETIRAIYEAFGRGDVPAILALLADDVDWNNDRVYSRECPWNGNFQGKANVPGFFQAVGENLQLHVFDPHTFVASGDHVMVMLRIEGQVTKNGQPFMNDAVHAWTFNGSGQVSAYRHYNDTAMELAAWRG